MFHVAAFSLGAALAVLGAPAAANAVSHGGQSSPAATPAITSMRVSPSPVSANGGKVTVTAKVRLGKTCTFSIKPKLTGFPVTRKCGTGSVTASLTFAANNSISAKHFVITLSVKGSSRTVSASRKLTQPPRTLSGVKTVVGQGQSYCALLVNGTVDCWGFNEFGQLGDGKLKTSSRPVRVIGVGGTGLLTGVASLVSGAFGYGDSYCAVLRSGGVDCWGYNADGQLGNGSTSSSDKPVQVKGVGGAGHLLGVTGVQPEIYSFCAALSSGGAACWGLNSDGELGTGSFSGPDSCGALATPCGTTPVDVVGVGGSGTVGNIARLTGEGASMCALLTTGGVDCWGYGPNGQLGNGSMSDSAVPVVVEGIGGTGSLAGVTSLSGYNSNGTSVCARLAAGGAACWGEDTWGELGNGTTGIFHDSPFPVEVKGVGGTGSLAKVAGVTGIPGLTNCALLTSGGADCWGFNGDSALGDPPVGISSNVPVKVTGIGGKGTLTGIASLNAGDGEAGGSVCALLTSGAVDCWGFASSGYSASPAPVAGFGATKPLVKVRALTSDEDGSTCAVLVSGGVDCWGDDSVGQLGNGATSLTVIRVPKAVLAPA